MSQNGKRREERPRITPLDDEEFAKFDQLLKRSGESEYGPVVDLLFRRLFLTISNLKVWKLVCDGVFGWNKDGTDAACPGYWRGRTRGNEVAEELKEKLERYETALKKLDSNFYPSEVQDCARRALDGS